MQEVEARTAVERVVAVPAGEHVVALVAFETVLALATFENVITQAAEKGVIAGLAAQRVRAGLALDPVVAIAAAQLVVAVAAAQAVCAVAARQGVVALVPRQRIVALAAFEPVVADPACERVVAAIALEEVVAVTAEEKVRPVATLQLVVALLPEQEVVSDQALQVVDVGTAVELVVAEPAMQEVDPGTAVEKVVAVIADEHVAALVAFEAVVALAAFEPVIAHTAQKVVVPRLTQQGVGAVLARDPIVAFAAAQGVIPEEAEDLVVAVPTIDTVIAFARQHGVVAGRGEDRVVPGITVKVIIAMAGVDKVVAVATMNDIALQRAGVSGGAPQAIVASAAEDRVIAFAALDGVVAIAPFDGVVAAQPVNDVIAGLALHGVGVGRTEPDDARQRRPVQGRHRVVEQAHGVIGAVEDQRGLVGAGRQGGGGRAARHLQQAGRAVQRRAEAARDRQHVIGRKRVAERVREHVAQGLAVGIEIGAEACVERQCRAEPGVAAHGQEIVVDHGRAVRRSRAGHDEAGGRGVGAAAPVRQGVGQRRRGGGAGAELRQDARRAGHVAGGVDLHGHVHGRGKARPAEAQHRLHRAAARQGDGRAGAVHHLRHRQRIVVGVGIGGGGVGLQQVGRQGLRVVEADDVVLGHGRAVRHDGVAEGHVGGVAGLTVGQLVARGQGEGAAARRHQTGARIDGHAAVAGIGDRDRVGRDRPGHAARIAEHQRTAHRDRLQDTREVAHMGHLQRVAIGVAVSPGAIVRQQVEALHAGQGQGEGIVARHRGGVAAGAGRGKLEHGDRTGVRQEGIGTEGAHHDLGHAVIVPIGIAEAGAGEVEPVRAEPHEPVRTVDQRRIAIGPAGAAEERDQRADLDAGGVLTLHVADQQVLDPVAVHVAAGREAHAERVGDHAAICAARLGQVDIRRPQKAAAVDHLDPCVPGQVVQRRQHDVVDAVAVEIHPGGGGRDQGHVRNTGEDREAGGPERAAAALRQHVCHVEAGGGPQPGPSEHDGRRALGFFVNHGDVVDAVAVHVADHLQPAAHVGPGNAVGQRRDTPGGQGCEVQRRRAARRDPVPEDVHAPAAVGLRRARVGGVTGDEGTAAGGGDDDVFYAVAVQVAHRDLDPEEAGQAVGLEQGGIRADKRHAVGAVQQVRVDLRHAVQPRAAEQHEDAPVAEAARRGALLIGGHDDVVDAVAVHVGHRAGVQRVGVEGSGGNLQHLPGGRHRQGAIGPRQRARAAEHHRGRAQHVRTVVEHKVVHPVAVHVARAGEGEQRAERITGEPDGGARLTRRKIARCGEGQCHVRAPRMEKEKAGMRRGKPLSGPRSYVI